MGISRISYSPSFLDEQDKFLKSEKLYDYVGAKPVAWLADSLLLQNDTAALNPISTCSFAVVDSLMFNGHCGTGKTATIKKISANRFEILTNSSSNCLLVLTQSYHHHWKAWVDGKEEKIYRTNFAFMGVNLTPGNHQVILRFVPTNTITALWILLITVLSLIITGAISLIAENKSRSIE